MTHSYGRKVTELAQKAKVQAILAKSAIAMAGTLALLQSAHATTSDAATAALATLDAQKVSLLADLTAIMGAGAALLIAAGLIGYLFMKVTGFISRAKP